MNIIVVVVQVRCALHIDAPGVQALARSAPRGVELHERERALIERIQRFARQLNDLALRSKHKREKESESESARVAGCEHDCAKF